jgi:hypothetical protein
MNSGNGLEARQVGAELAPTPTPTQQLGAASASSGRLIIEGQRQEDPIERFRKMWELAQSGQASPASVDLFEVVKKAKEATMNVECSGGSNGGGSSLTEVRDTPPSVDNVVPGSRWQAVGSRKDGRRTVVAVLSRVGPLRVEIEDTESGKRKTIQSASLLTNYTRIASASPTALDRAARSEHGTATQLNAEVAKLAGALREARRPGTRITTIEWEVTPALAEALLRNNPSNRTPSPDVIWRYAHDLWEGNWAVSHQGVALGPDLEVGDGGHRFLAIVKTGIPADILVAWYHDRRQYESARHTWDEGYKRSKAHVLELVGLVPRGQGRCTAALLHAVTYVDGRYPSQPTNNDIVVMYKQDKVSVAAVAELRPSEFLAPTRAAFLIAHRKAPKEIEQCIRLVTTKAGIDSGSAAQALVLLLPKLQRTKAQADRVGLMKDVLALLYKHVRQEPGVTVIKQNKAAYRFFLGEHFRERVGR